MGVKQIDPATISIVTYPHPTLRYKSKPIRRVDNTLRAIVARMFDLMYEHRGVGLAANQVDLPLRLFVMNAAGNRGEGEERVFINPVITRPRGSEEAEEGCLSLPGVYGNVVRPKTIHLHAYDLQGNEIDTDFHDFEARVIQHETDHLDGVLFIDRLKQGAEVEIAEELEGLAAEFRAQQRSGAVASEDELLNRLREWEARYCG